MKGTKLDYTVYFCVYRFLILGQIATSACREVKGSKSDCYYTIYYGVPVQTTEFACIGFRILSLTVRSLLGPDVGGDLEDVPHQDQDPFQDELVILQPLVPVFPQQVAKDTKCQSTLIAFTIRFTTSNADPHRFDADKCGPGYKRMQRILPASGSGCVVASRIRIWNYLYGSRSPPPPPFLQEAKNIDYLISTVL